jgi:hypothetical protein
MMSFPTRHLPSLDSLTVKKTISWPGGGSFEGTVDAQGNFVKGRMIWGEQSANRGQSYEGEWMNGVMHGQVNNEARIAVFFLLLLLIFFNLLMKSWIAGHVYLER